MPEQISRDDRIAIDPEMHEIFKGLSDGTDLEEVPFGQLKDVFLMAACLGYARKKRRPLPAKTRDIIRLETFSQSDLPVLYALAIATTGDVDILDQGYGFLTIAEEYANEGIHILQENLLNQRGRPLWNLVDLVRSEVHSD